MLSRNVGSQLLTYTLQRTRRAKTPIYIPFRRRRRRWWCLIENASGKFSDRILVRAKNLRKRPWGQNSLYLRLQLVSGQLWITQSSWWFNVRQRQLLHILSANVRTLLTNLNLVVLSVLVYGSFSLHDLCDRLPDAQRVSILLIYCFVVCVCVWW